MNKLLKYLVINILVINTPLIIGNIFNLGTTNNNLAYFFESIQGIIIFYIALFFLDKMKAYAVKHSQYNNPYEQTLTKERANLFIKFTSGIQFFFLILLIAVPLSLFSYIDNSLLMIVISVFCFLLSFLVGLNYFFVITKHKYIGGSK